MAYDPEDGKANYEIGNWLIQPQLGKTVAVSKYAEDLTDLEGPEFWSVFRAIKKLEEHEKYGTAGRDDVWIKDVVANTDRVVRVPPYFDRDERDGRRVFASSALMLISTVADNSFDCTPNFTRYSAEREAEEKLRKQIEAVDEARRAKRFQVRTMIVMAGGALGAVAAVVATPVAIPLLGGTAVAAIFVPRQWWE
jgi:hypothetical protein